MIKAIEEAENVRSFWQAAELSTPAAHEELLRIRNEDANSDYDDLAWTWRLSQAATSCGMGMPGMHGTYTANKVDSECGSAHQHRRSLR